MKFIILYTTAFLFFTAKINAQNHQNSLEGGINGDYWVSKYGGGFRDRHKNKMPYLAYTRLIGNYYIKLDYRWSNFEVIPFTRPYVFENYKDHTILKQDKKIYSIGIAYKTLFKLKNTQLFLNLTYLDYKDFYYKYSWGWEHFAYFRKLKEFGVGSEIKQRFNINSTTYAHLNIGLNYFRSKLSPYNTLGAPIPSWQMTSSIGLGRRF